MCRLFELQFLFEVENLRITALHERVVVRFEVCDEFRLALARSHEVLHVLLKHGGFLHLVEAAGAVLHRVVEALDLALLRGVLLHADLRVTRVEIGFRDLLRDGLHSILAHLAHAHLRTLVKRVSLGHCQVLLLRVLLLRARLGLTLHCRETLTAGFESLSRV